MLALFPVRCGGCNLTLNERPQYLLCPVCAEALLENPLPLPIKLPKDGKCHAPYVYGGPLETMIWRAKFRGREDLAESLGKLMIPCPRARSLAQQSELLMPIPLSPFRHFKRGYNQSAHIAKVLGQAWNLPMQTRWKRRHTQAQHTLGRAARSENIRGAFCLPKGVHGKRILLIDDVVTTGATIREAARVLVQAGARQVHALACAGPDWSYLKN